MTDPVLNEVKVDVSHKSRKLPGGPTETEMEKRPISKALSRRNSYVYVNSAYTGSLNSVNSNIQTEPPTR